MQLVTASERHWDWLVSLVFKVYEPVACYLKSKHISIGKL